MEIVKRCFHETTLELLLSQSYNSVLLDLDDEDYEPSNAVTEEAVLAHLDSVLHVEEVRSYPVKLAALTDSLLSSIRR